MARNALKLSIMVGEIFEISWSQMTRNAFNCPPWLEKILKYANLKWLEIHLNCPPWLEKILKYAKPQMARNALKLSTMVGENTHTIALFSTGDEWREG